MQTPTSEIRGGSCYIPFLMGKLRLPEANTPPPPAGTVHGALCMLVPESGLSHGGGGEENGVSGMLQVRSSPVFPLFSFRSWIFPF